MTRIDWKFCFCSLHSQWWFKFLEKVLIWLKKVNSTKKLLISKAESFLKSNFHLNQICKIVLTQSHYIWNFNAVTCFIFLLKIGQMLSSYRKFFKNWRLKETRPSCDKKFSCSDNHGQNIWNKIEKSSKIGQDKKSLISSFTCFFNYFFQSLISGRDTGKGCLDPNMRLF